MYVVLDLSPFKLYYITMTTPNLSSFMTPIPRSTSVRPYFATDVVSFVQKLVDSYSK